MANTSVIADADTSFAVIQEEADSFLAQCHARVENTDMNGNSTCLKAKTPTARRVRTKTLVSKGMNTKEDASFDVSSPATAKRKAGDAHDNDFSSPNLCRANRVVAPRITAKKRKLLTRCPSASDNLLPKRQRMPKGISTEDSFRDQRPHEVHWRTLLSSVKNHHKEGYPTANDVGNQTPEMRQRGVQPLLASMKEIRCYAPYDGLCGYHCLAKLLDIEISTVLEILVNWSAGPDSEVINVELTTTDNFNRFEVINGHVYRNQACTRAKLCLEHLRNAVPGSPVGTNLYCTLEDVVIILQLKKLRGLILSDVQSMNPSVEAACDYYVCEGGVQELRNTTLIPEMERGVHYDVIIINESEHWVYAMPMGNDTDPPHTRGQTDAVAARTFAKVSACFIFTVRMHNEKGTQCPPLMLYFAGPVFPGESIARSADGARN